MPVGTVRFVGQFFYIVVPVVFKMFPLSVTAGEAPWAGQLSQPPRGGLSAVLIPKLCGVFHKLFTGPTPSSGAGTEAKIISVWNKQNGVWKRMNSFALSVDCS